MKGMDVRMTLKDKFQEQVKSLGVQLCKALEAKDLQRTEKIIKTFKTPHLAQAFEKLGSHPVNAIGLYNRTPLIQAIHSGLKNGVSMLLDAGADANKHDGNGALPLNTALELNMDPEIAFILLNQGRASICQEGHRSAFAVAALVNNAEFITTLMRQSFDPTKVNFAFGNYMNDYGAEALYNALTILHQEKFIWAADGIIENLRSQKDTPQSLLSAIEKFEEETSHTYENALRALENLEL